MPAVAPGADGLRIVQRPAEDTKADAETPVETDLERKAREAREFQAFLVRDRARRMRSIGP